MSVLRILSPNTPLDGIKLIASLLAVLLLAACGSPRDVLGPFDSEAESSTSPAEPRSSSGSPGIGGTGDVAGEGNGIGGTGTYAGTPGIGGTGIIGTITAFGSIFVNGYEIDYAPDMAISHKDGGLRPDALRLGQVVAVEADGEGARLSARSIVIRHEVAGPIERINTSDRSLTVMGQRISIDKGASSLPIDQLKPGDVIDVSGSRRADGVIVASRLDRSAPGAVPMLRGRVTAIDSRGFLVNGQRVEGPAAIRPAGLRSGQDVVISGNPSGSVLRARRIDLQPQTPFRGRVSRLSIEGYSRRNRDGTTTVGGVRLRRPQGAIGSTNSGRVIIEGGIDRRGTFQQSRVRPNRLRLQRGRNPGLLRPRDRSSPLLRRAPAPNRRPLLRRPSQPRILRPAPRRRDRILRDRRPLRR